MLAFFLSLSLLLWCQSDSFSIAPYPQNLIRLSAPDV